MNRQDRMDYSKREQRGWYAYDWASSTFHSTVLTLFLGPYLTMLAKVAADASGRVHPFGIPVEPRSWWGYLVSLSVAMEAIALPFIGTIADFSPHKKRLLAVLAYTGALATIAMFFLQDGNYLAGGILFLIANLAFGASIVVYNSFLPDIAPPEQRDAVSSRGWAIGYLGCGLLLVLNLALFAKASALGISESFAVRINLASAGVWWALFTLVPLMTIRKRPPGRHRGQAEGLIRSFREFIKTVSEMRRYAIAIAATNYNSGKSHLFIQGKKDHPMWNRVRRVTLATKITVEHLCASAAIPLVF
jgi:MFS transporter, UMF1 family